MAKMPNFAIGELSKLQNAVNRGILSYPTYVFVSDKDMMAFVDEDRKLRLVNGNNKVQVQNVTALPPTIKGEKDVLYILNGTVYTFDGSKYIAQYTDYSNTFNDIYAKINGLGLNKVDKREGMGLSHNDLTDEMVQKLNHIGANGIEESDPTVPQHVKDITEEDIATWNANSDLSKKIRNSFRVEIAMGYDQNDIWYPKDEAFKLYLNNELTDFNTFCNSIDSSSDIMIALIGDTDKLLINNIDIYKEEQFIEINSNSLAKNIQMTFNYDSYAREWSSSSLTYYPFYNETACLVILDEDGNIVTSDFNGVPLDVVPLNYPIFNPIRYFDMNFADGSRAYGTADYANDEYYIEDTDGNKHIIYLDYGFDMETGEVNIVVKYRKIDASEVLTEVNWDDVIGRPNIIPIENCDEVGDAIEVSNYEQNGHFGISTIKIIIDNITQAYNSVSFYINQELCILTNTMPSITIQKNKDSIYKKVLDFSRRDISIMRGDLLSIHSNDTEILIKWGFKSWRIDAVNVDDYENPLVISSEIVASQRWVQDQNYATKQDVDNLIIVSDEEPTEGKVWINKNSEEIEILTPSDLEDYATKEYVDEKTSGLTPSEPFEQVQANWDITDKDEPSYIQNKPFGSFLDYKESNTLPFHGVFIPGFYAKTIEISCRINGSAIFNKTCEIGSDGYTYIDTNFSSKNQLHIKVYRSTNTGYIMFNIGVNDGWEDLISSIYYVSISISAIKTIDTEYLPTSIQADWNEEDETQLSFIKNTGDVRAKLNALDEFFDLNNAREIMVDMGFIEGGEGNDY